MRYNPLGDSGLMVSVVGVGCNAFGARIDEDQTKAVVDAAIEHLSSTSTTAWAHFARKIGTSKLAASEGRCTTTITGRGACSPR